MRNNFNLLLFSVHNLRFGVYAEQVEELLEDHTLYEQDETGIEYRISYKGQDIRVIRFPKWIAKECEARNKTQLDLQTPNLVSKHQEEEDSYVSLPKILIIKHRCEEYIGVRINDPEDLATVSINQIYPLPIMMQKTRRIQGLWGIALVKNRVVILIDLTQL